mmetsp:Transcript_86427/g.241810  ORF Transcript_86427/g.241810 Transcript_86427/m.241810 type:complete len:217 (-) Transcript_86427:2581-3231(-)
MTLRRRLPQIQHRVTRRGAAVAWWTSRPPLRLCCPRLPGRAGRGKQCGTQRSGLRGAPVRRRDITTPPRGSHSSTDSWSSRRCPNPCTGAAIRGCQSGASTRGASVTSPPTPCGKSPGTPPLWMRSRFPPTRGCSCAPRCGVAAAAPRSLSPAPSEGAARRLRRCFSAARPAREKASPRRPWRRNWKGLFTPSARTTCSQRRLLGGPRWSSRWRRP